MKLDEKRLEIILALYKYIFQKNYRDDLPSAFYFERLGYIVDKYSVTLDDIKGLPVPSEPEPPIPEWDKL